METWQETFAHEIETAKAARSADNESRARVCARRAAGIAIGEYLRGEGYSLSNKNAYERIKFLDSLPGLPVDIHQIAQYLLERVNPDFQLPSGVDLIKEAERLREILFPT